MNWTAPRAISLVGLAGLAGALLLALLGLGGCSGDPGSGPLPPRWDRSTCERCRMMLSDRQHGAQVRIKATNGTSQVLYFDDLGCALIWLEAKPAPDRDGAEIWVTDWRSGDWIDARAAHYASNQVTPMGYGLGAQREDGAGLLDFPQAKAHVFAVEHRHNLGGPSGAPALAP